MKNRMLEVHDIEKMVSEAEEKLFGITYRIMNATH